MFLYWLTYIFCLYLHTLTFQVAWLCVSEVEWQLLKALGQWGDHISQEPVFLLCTMTTLSLQARHGPLAPVKHLQTHIRLNTDEKSVLWCVQWLIALVLLCVHFNLFSYNRWHCNKTRFLCVCVLYLCNFLCSDLDGMLLLTAVIQRGPVHVFVVQTGQFLHLLTYTCDFILNLWEQGIHCSLCWLWIEVLFGWKYACESQISSHLFSCKKIWKFVNFMGVTSSLKRV